MNPSPDPVAASEQPTCDYCGWLGWTVEKYGRVTHKQGCPHRTDPWHQGDPTADPPAANEQRVFILMRGDPSGEESPVAVYTFDQREACRADRDHRQSVNPNSHYYVIDKPLNPKAES